MHNIDDLSQEQWSNLLVKSVDYFIYVAQIDRATYINELGDMAEQCADEFFSKIVTDPLDHVDNDA